MDEKQLTYYFQILSDMNRLKIINLIGKKEISVSEIVSEMKLSQPLVSHHLRIMKDSEILETKRKGPFIYYRLKNPKLLDVLGLFGEVLPKGVEEEIPNPMFNCPQCFKEFIR